MENSKYLTEKEIEKIRVKAKMFTYYQGLNTRLQYINGELSKIEASTKLWESQSFESRTENSELGQMYTTLYKKVLEEEAVVLKNLIDL